jgi:hypothetical protein
MSTVLTLSSEVSTGSPTDKKCELLDQVADRAETSLSQSVRYKGVLNSNFIKVARLKSSFASSAMVAESIALVIILPQ